MKAIKTDRFTNKKPEEISFSGSPILENPPKKEVRTNEQPFERTRERTNNRSSEHLNERTGERVNTRTPERKNENNNEKANTRTNERVNERTDEQVNEQINKQPSSAYQIEIPSQRQKIRHSFDIFEDQRIGLEKMQQAMSEYTGAKRLPLGTLAREAIDLYLKQKSKEIKNIQIIKLPVQANERTDEQVNE